MKKSAKTFLKKGFPAFQKLFMTLCAGSAKGFARKECAKPFGFESLSRLKLSKELFKF
jgi:hypothetical protein